ncbi:MAG TPA: adenine phosphoribosyltransferase [Chthonomonadales bacterium]|nr:adenine phosphoribosyltransferase [Chthonomonadales bacterium]
MSRLLAEALVRDIPDFPRPGILFKDITPVLADYAAMRQALDVMKEHAQTLSPDLVLGIEARGFIFGAPLALELGVGFAPLRKLGKLPHHRITEEYELEYGTNQVELHADAAPAGSRVLIVDDLLATGGTAAAAVRLVERLDASVAGLMFLIELEFLNGRERLGSHTVHSLIRYR